MRIGCSCVGMLLALGTVHLNAQPVQIAQGDCRSGIRLVAREAPLVDVLKQLSQALGFELRYEGDDARLINVNVTRAPVELISSLSAQDSIIVTQAKDPNCPGRDRVVKVWVLPTSQTSSRVSSSGARTTPAASAPARSFVNEKVIRASPELDEQSRRAKAAYDEYVRIHSVAPPGVEEEAAKK